MGLRAYTEVCQQSVEIKTKCENSQLSMKSWEPLMQQDFWISAAANMTKGIYQVSCPFF